MKTILTALFLLTSSVTWAAPMDTSLDRPVPRATKAAAPAKGPDVAGVETATCRDGMTYYHPTGEHRGACSGHGGVAQWADGSPVKSHGRKGAYR